MSTTEKVQKLKEISFFMEVPERDLSQIAAITAERHYKPGEIIIEENSIADSFFIIYKGKIEIIKKFEDSDDIVLGVHSDGEFFGEMPILDGGPRSASARAVESTVLMVVSYKDFERVLGVVPQIAYTIMKELGVRLRQTGALLALQLKKKNRELEEASLYTLRSIVRFKEKNLFFMDHSGRTARLAADIGTLIGLDEEAVHSLELGGELHDVGMIGVSDTILLKPGELSDSEMALIKRHTEDGREMIEKIQYLKHILPHVESHHERFDGSGYPRHLSGKEIPLGGRIIALADVFTAMTSERPWRGKLTSTEVVSWILEDSGSAFDPEILEVFKGIIKGKNFPKKYL